MKTMNWYALWLYQRHKNFADAESSHMLLAWCSVYHTAGHQHTGLDTAVVETLVHCTKHALFPLVVTVGSFARVQLHRSYDHLCCLPMRHVISMSSAVKSRH